MENETAVRIDLNKGSGTRQLADGRRVTVTKGQKGATRRSRETVVITIQDAEQGKILVRDPPNG